MFDKKKMVEEYIPHFKKSLDCIRNICLHSSHNLIVINVNTSTTMNLAFSQLKRFGLNLYAPKIDDIEIYGSLGNLLRNKIHNEANDDILVLDFCYELKQLSDKIATTVNLNRDLFAEAFNSTIIFASSQEIYEMRHYASDFWSCVNQHFDLTKWFFSPIPLPIAKVRTFANTDSALTDFFVKDVDLYNSYVSLYNYIKSIKSYNYSLFEEVFVQIKKFPDGIGKIELINKFGECLTTAQVSKGLSEKRLNDVSLFISNTSDSIQFVDMIAMCAEFYYRYGMFDEAILCYQKIVRILDNLWGDTNKELIISFLLCNIVICRYAKSYNHNPKKLLEELKERIYIDKVEYSDEERDFINNYLFLVDYTVQHHSFAQHKDIYARLKNNSVYALPMIDISETKNICYFWEEFSLGNLVAKYANIGDPVLEKIYVKIQEMIYYFSKNDYFASRNAYKIAVGLSKNYGYIQIYNMIYCFNKNMIYLHESSKLYT